MKEMTLTFPSRRRQRIRKWSRGDHVAPEGLTVQAQAGGGRGEGKRDPGTDSGRWTEVKRLNSPSHPGKHGTTRKSLQSRCGSQ